ncbi:MAG: multiheme c-type cytochrome, partial [Planctomycetota bacterium]
MQGKAGVLSRDRLAAAILLLCAVAWSSAVAGQQAPNGEAPTYVTQTVCAECHAAQVRAWTGSHHDLAMQEATAATVLGNFDDARVSHFGVTSTFFRRDGGFYVHTDGPDGELRDYPIAYTFGAAPLQQYLIAFPGGRYQALGLAWDTRPAAAGGQRWFHLYPNQEIPHDDELHWTARLQNWNGQCAECHSTGLRKTYDPDDDSFATTWSEIDVSCEACHGPGSAHVAWARAAAVGEQGENGGAKGLVVDFHNGGAAGAWQRRPGEATAAWSGPARSWTELAVCAPCHARRRGLVADPGPGRPFLDTHMPRLLDPGLYHADGQILDEVFVYGSFVQSRMYRAGVTCSDCHDPHGLEPRLAGNVLCGQC